jgi:predicted protein tyrosine phosphatase
MLTRPFPQVVVEAGQAPGHALISIRQSWGGTVAIPVGFYEYGVLPLQFDDIPVPEWTDAKGTAWKGPTLDHLKQALTFAHAVCARNKDAFITVHCHQGKSRSAAIALAILADHLGVGQEEAAVRALLDHDVEGQMCFNPGLVRMADGLLNGEGRLEAALEKSCPPFVTWRAYWQQKQRLNF